MYKMKDSKIKFSKRGENEPPGYPNSEELIIAIITIGWATL